MGEPACRRKSFLSVFICVHLWFQLLFLESTPPKHTDTMSNGSKPGTPKAAIDLAKQQGAKMVDIKFVDTFGTWQHFSVPTSELTEEVFTDGLGFDGSSIRGWKSIEASDMLAMPDPASAFIDPFCAVPTLSLTCTIAET